MKTITITLLLIISSLLHANEPQTIILGSIDQPPWCSINANNELVGSSVDFANQLSTLTGINIQSAIYPSARLVKAIEKSQVDLSFFLNSQRPVNTIPIIKILSVDIQLLTKHKIDIDSYQSLKKYRIGQIAGGTYSSTVKPLRKKNNFIPLHSYQQGIELLQKDRLDGVLGLSPSMDIAVKKYAAPEKNFYRTILSSEDVFLHSSPELYRDKEKIEKIKSGSEELIKTGAVKEILIKHFSKQN